MEVQGTSSSYKSSAMATHDTKASTPQARNNHKTPFAVASYPEVGDSFGTVDEARDILEHNSDNWKGEKKSYGDHVTTYYNETGKIGEITTMESTDKNGNVSNNKKTWIKGTSRFYPVTLWSFENRDKGKISYMQSSHSENGRQVIVRTEDKIRNGKVDEGEITREVIQENPFQAPHEAQKANTRPEDNRANPKATEKSEKSA